MLIKTDYSLFNSAITLKEAITASVGYSVLMDDNLFAVPTFVYECRSQNKKPIVGLHKELNGAKYMFIALNEEGYRTLVKYESLGFREDIFEDKNIFSAITDIINESENIVNTHYMVESSLEVNNIVLRKYCNEVLGAKIVNGVKDSDIYTLGLINAIGTERGFDETVVKVKFNNDKGNLGILDNLVNPIEDYLEFGDPKPPLFKFREEVAKEEGISAVNDYELFDHLCRKGLTERLVNIDSSEHASYLERLEFEMNVIKGMNFPGYMLIVWDFVNAAKDMGIPVGPGRGSAAGSIVAYVLKITNIDPMKYGLLFERFLNPDRVSFPDIDMDFARDGRDKIIQYVYDKYGKECVSQVITFGKIGGKSSVRDAARVYRAPLALADKIAKAIPEKPGMTLSKAYEESPDTWNTWFSEDYVVDKIWKGAEKISGFTRNLGVHAAGLIIGTVPVHEKAPLYKVGDAQVVGFDGKYLEDVDLVKFDFLGLKTLDVIDNTIKLIKSNHNVEVDFSDAVMEDKKTFDFISKGNTAGLFQIESPGMRGLAKSLRPDKFEEIIAMLALYRPGPMEAGMLESFINRKHGREKVDYFFPDMEEALKPILEPTYGLIVYQEQVMQIVQAIAGFSLGEADLVRRAMGKKKLEEMERISKDFANRAEKKGYVREEAVKLFDLIEKFAGYGFNKSHSAAYAMVTYQTAFLKTYYPLEFLTALLNSEIGNTDKISAYINDAKILGINIIAPDINKCDTYFKTVDNNSIAFGLKSIKGVGSGSETLKKAILHLNGSTNLKKILELTQINVEVEREATLNKIERLKNQLANNIKNKIHSESMISKINDKVEFNEKCNFTESLSERDSNSLIKHNEKVIKFNNKITELNATIESLGEKLELLNTIPSNSMDKVNKRVFESLASVGALSCFGYTRKDLVDNVSKFLNNSIKDSDITGNEFEPSEIMSLEESNTGVILTTPFSKEILSLETTEEQPIGILVSKTIRKKKSGEDYIQIKIMTTTGDTLDMSDFNKKSLKFEVGDIVSIYIRVNGKYTNLQNIKKLNVSDFSSKKRELEITVLDTIPENISDYDSIRVTDLDGSLIAVLS